MARRRVGPTGDRSVMHDVQVDGQPIPMLPVSQLTPVPWVRERDIDLLLAELFVVEPPFVAWFVSQPPTRSGTEGPSGEPSVVHAAVNYSRHGADGDATGE